MCACIRSISDQNPQSHKHIFFVFFTNATSEKLFFNFLSIFSIILYFHFLFSVLTPKSCQKKSVCVSVCTHILIEEESHSHKVDIGSEASKKRSVSNKKERKIVGWSGRRRFVDVCLKRKIFLCAAWRKKKEDIKRKKIDGSSFSCPFFHWIARVFIDVTLRIGFFFGLKVDDFEDFS